MTNYEELKLTVKLEKVHKFDLNKSLDVDKTQINDEMSEQPGHFAWYATLAELAKNKVLHLKTELEQKEAELDQKIRKNWDIDQCGKMTEAGVSAAIKLTPVYQQLTIVYQEALKNQGILQVAKQAFEQRHMMLISIAANMRGEGDADLRVNKEKVAATIKKMRNPS